MPSVVVYGTHEEKPARFLGLDHSFIQTRTNQNHVFAYYGMSWLGRSLLLTGNEDPTAFFWGSSQSWASSTLPSPGHLGTHTPSRRGTTDPSVIGQPTGPPEPQLPLGEDSLWLSQVAGPAQGDRDGQQAAGDAPRGRRDASRGEWTPAGAVAAPGEAVLRRPHQHPVHLGNRRPSDRKWQEASEWSLWDQVLCLLCSRGPRGTQREPLCPTTTLSTMPTSSV